MLPAKTVVQPLPSISTIMSDAPTFTPADEYYSLDPYSTSLINIAYQPSAIYINQWQGFHAQPYAVHTPYVSAPAQYPMMGTQSLQDSIVSGTDAAMSPLSPYSLDDTDCSFTGSEEKSKSRKGTKRRAGSKGLARSDGICSHCSTTTTTLWRKNESGALECNACNLYYRRNSKKRPLTLCKEKISTRNRRRLKNDDGTLARSVPL